MTYLTDSQKRVLFALRTGPDDAYHLAELLKEAPFCVRGDLKALKRLRLVQLHFTHRSLLWILTSRGEDLAFSLNQQELFR